MHTALWVLAATSLIGAGVSMLRPSDESAPVEAGERHGSPSLSIEEAISEEIEATP